ncbi:hypothetical protein [Methylibium rhizosphaerae]|uniref:hypothetical protein n=1 Tax=Methylibium rhizosphaerae TaxID=2570323 RepID=UPI00112AA2B4|nr:hypothetical protein [Methylibium rhizosphaerae]
MNNHAALLAQLPAMPTPLVRRLHAIFTASTGRSVPGAIDVLDYGTGSSEHVVSLSAMVDGAMLHFGMGEIRGLRFKPSVNRGGRPRKTARDMAVFLACQWHATELHQRWPGARAAGKARDSVCELWQQKGYKGLSDERKVRNILDKVKDEACFKGGCVASFLGEADGSGRLSLLMEAGGRIETTTDQIFMEGKGWVWAYGEETATYMHISGEGTGRCTGKCWP